MQKAQDFAHRDCLIEEYQSYVHQVARKLIHLMNLPFELLDEIVSSGYVGLVEAAERFNASQGVDFRTYAFLRIRGAMIDNIRNTSDLTGKAYKSAKALKAVQEL